MAQFNRILGCICYMGLGGWIAYLAAAYPSTMTKEFAIAIMAAAGSPLLAYVGIKGIGTGKSQTP